MVPSVISSTYRTSGFTLIEALLSGTLLLMMVTAFFGAYLYGQESLVLSGKRAQAAQLADEGLEAVRSIRDAQFDALIDGTYGLAYSGGGWSLSGSSDAIDVFTRTITIATIDTDRKSITAQVTWQQNAQRNGTLTLETYLSNWQETAAPGSSTCEAFCQDNGYTTGTCRQNTNRCTQNGETYEADGDAFCTGSPAANTCCCLP